MPGLQRNSISQRFQIVGGHGIEIGLEAVAPAVVFEEHGLRAGEQRRAFVDLIERIRHRDHGLRPVPPCADHRLHEREQRLARAVDRQHHGLRVDAARRSLKRRSSQAAQRGARFRQAGGDRIAVELAELAAQRLDDECRRRVLGLADRHGDVRQRWRAA